mmetsp:Transcript_2746/g.7742  ORF Transcript_2746/g.7742 Transcript_2746/m.7742 type:complete len:233 (+) Transcript_2746:2375-3073(+)
MFPKKASLAHSSSSSVMCSHGRRSETSDSASYDAVASPSLIVPVYSFSCSIKLSRCLVPLPTHIITSPVAMGSNVPAWPTFLIRRAPRSFPQRSKDVQSRGLSTRTIAFCQALTSLGRLGGVTRTGGSGSFFFFLIGGLLPLSTVNADALPPPWGLRLLSTPRGLAWRLPLTFLVCVLCSAAGEAHERWRWYRKGCEHARLATLPRYRITFDMEFFLGEASTGADARRSMSW